MSPKTYWRGWAALLTTFAIIGWLAARPSHASEKTVTSQRLLSSASAMNAAGTVGAGYLPQCRETVVYVVWSAGTSAGTVLVEAAHDAAYTGTWGTLSTVGWATASSVTIARVAGVHNAIRTRISSAIMGGTVDSWLTCN